MLDPVSGPFTALQGRQHWTVALATVHKPVPPQTSLLLILTIEPEVFKAAIRKIIFHDRHEGGHLTEEQHFVASGTEFGKDPIKQLKLPRGSVQVQPGEQGAEEEHISDGPWQTGRGRSAPPLSRLSTWRSTARFPQANSPTSMKFQQSHFNPNQIRSRPFSVKGEHMIIIQLRYF